MTEKRDQRWATPRSLVHWAAERWGPFDLDAAASADNAVCERFIDQDADGLRQGWSGVVWCNPPWANVGKWVRKARAEVVAGHVDRVVMLLPVRADQPWFHHQVLPFGRITWIEGRVAFVDPQGLERSRPNEAAFLVVFEAGLKARDFRE